MKIPKKIYLYGLPIKIVIDKSINKKCSGRAEFRNLTIRLASNLNKAHLESTYLHELIHFIFFFGKLQKKLNDKVLLHDNEDIVETTSLLLHQALCNKE